MRLHLLVIFFFIVSFKTYSKPSITEQLNEISRGPEIKPCDDDKSASENEAEVDEELATYETLDELEENESVISWLFQVEPVDLDSKGMTKDSSFSISVEIPAYGGRPSELIRSVSNPYNIRSYFHQTGRDLNIAGGTRNLQREIISSLTPVAGRIDPIVERRVKESIAILDYSSMISNGNFQDASKFLELNYRGKSTEEKLSFLGSLLSTLNDNYDKSILNQGLGGKDISSRELARAIFLNNDGIGSTAELKAGVCRHIHQFAVQAARQMGLKLSFGVTYPVANGYHATMVVSDPRNPGRTYKLNYGGMKRVDSGRGSSVLEHDEGILSSNGITFHMWGENDQPVYFLPSDRGIVLAEIAGEDLSNFDPNIRPTATKVMAGIKLGRNKLKVFHAKTPSGKGEKVSGVALTRTIPFNRFVTGNYGVVGYATDKVNSSGSNKPNSATSFETTTAGIYFYVDHEFNVNLVENKDLKLKLFSRFSLRGTGYFSQLRRVYDTPSGPVRGDSSSSFLGDGSGQIISGLEANVGDRLTLGATSDVSGQITDITAQGGGFNLYARRFSFDGSYSFVPSSGLKLTANNRFNLIPLEGNNIMVGSSSVDLANTTGTRQLHLGVLYPISDIVPGYIPGALTTLEASVRASFFSGHLGLSISGYVTPGQRHRSISSETLEETQMRQQDFMIQDSSGGPQEVDQRPTEFGIGVTGEIRY